MKPFQILNISLHFAESYLDLVIPSVIAFLNHPFLTSSECVYNERRHAFESACLSWSTTLTKQNKIFFLSPGLFLGGIDSISPVPTNDSRSASERSQARSGVGRLQDSHN